MPLVQLSNGLWHESASSELGGQKLDANFELLDGTLVEPVTVTVNGAGDIIPTGSLGFKRIDYAAQIIGWRMFASAAGNAVIDVKAGTFPTTASIVAAAPPTLTAAQIGSDTALTDWTTAISTGTTLEFVVTGTPTVTYVQLILFLRRV